jgi:hypothetical protein
MTLNNYRALQYMREMGHVAHVPPPTEQLPARLAALCAFANEPELALVVATSGSSRNV